MHKYFFLYLVLFFVTICCASVIESSSNFKNENSFKLDFFTQYADFSSDLNEEEHGNETYTFKSSSYSTIYLLIAKKLGFQKIDYNFILLHYEVNSEPPELKA